MFAYCFTARSAQRTSHQLVTNNFFGIRKNKMHNYDKKNSISKQNTELGEETKHNIKGKNKMQYYEKQNGYLTDLEEEQHAELEEKQNTELEEKQNTELGEKQYAELEGNKTQH